MADNIPRQRADRTQLQQIIAGLTEGVIIVNPDQTIAWANQTALTLHGIKSVQELGETVSEYRERFELRYQNQHKLPEGDYPMERLLAGEAFSEVVVHVARPGEDKHWVHQIRSLVLTDPKGQPDCLVRSSTTRPSSSTPNSASSGRSAPTRRRPSSPGSRTCAT